MAKKRTTADERIRMHHFVQALPAGLNPMEQVQRAQAHVLHESLHQATANRSQATRILECWANTVGGTQPEEPEEDDTVLSEADFAKMRKFLKPGLYLVRVE